VTVEHAGKNNRKTERPEQVESAKIHCEIEIVGQRIGDQASDASEEGNDSMRPAIAVPMKRPGCPCLEIG
jgi:hypothetical protein